MTIYGRGSLPMTGWRCGTNYRPAAGGAPGTTRCLAAGQSGGERAQDRPCPAVAAADRQRTLHDRPGRGAPWPEPPHAGTDLSPSGWSGARADGSVATPQACQSPVGASRVVAQSGRSGVWLPRSGALHPPFPSPCRGNPGRVSAAQVDANLQGVTVCRAHAGHSMSQIRSASCKSMFPVPISIACSPNWCRASSRPRRPWKPQASSPA